MFDINNALRYYLGANLIRSFICKDTQALFEREWISKIPENIQRSALRKLRILDAAVTFADSARESS